MILFKMNINYHNFAICSNTHVGSVDTNAGSDKAVHAVNHFHAPVIFPHKRLNNRQWEKLAGMCVTRKNYINTVRIVIRQMIRFMAYQKKRHRWIKILCEFIKRSTFFVPISGAFFIKTSVR